MQHVQFIGEREELVICFSNASFFLQVEETFIFVSIGE
jgi:hypothetical protein